VRLRAAHVARFVQRHAPDVLCLQEIKCREAEFPVQAFADAGLPYLKISGQKAGTAWRSLRPCPSRTPRPRRLPRGPRPLRLGQGRGSGDPELLRSGRRRHARPIVNPKFDHKLDFLERLTVEMRRRTRRPRSSSPGPQRRPGEHDVWNHRFMSRIVSHTPVEVEAMEALRASLGFIDLTRAATPEPVKLFSGGATGRRFPPLQPRPASRSHLDQSRARGVQPAGRQRRGPGARRGPRLGASQRPRASKRRPHSLTPALASQGG